MLCVSLQNICKKKTKMFESLFALNIADIHHSYTHCSYEHIFQHIIILKEGRYSTFYNVLINIISPHLPSSFFFVAAVQI